MKLWAPVAAGLLACLLAGGCSSDSSGSGSGTTTTTSSRRAVCAVSAKVQQSVRKVVDPTTLTGGKREVTAAIKSIRSDLDALGDSVKQDVEPDVAAVREAIDQLETAAAELRSASIPDGVTAGISNFADAAAQVGSTVANLTAVLQPDCAG